MRLKCWKLPLVVVRKLKKKHLVLVGEMWRSGEESGRKTETGDVVGAGAVTGDTIVTGAETDTGDGGVVAEIVIDTDTDIGEAEAGTEGI